MAYRSRYRGMGSLTTDLAGAIQRMEGACTSGTCRNNNPGNLRAGNGATGVDSRGFAIFPDYATGEAALQRQVDRNIGRGLTLDEFFGGKTGVYAGYAPAADSNNPSLYASTVGGWLGIDPNVPLAQLQSGDSGVPYVDSGSMDDTYVPSDTASAGISDGALIALGIAGIGLVIALAV